MVDNGTNVVLSIVVPVYNTPGLFLDECLQSLLKISFTVAYEIIVVNDGSTQPETIACLKKWEGTDGISVFHKENGGVSSARNLGISKSGGTYILPFDADDIALEHGYPQALQRMLKDSTIDIIYGDYIKFGDENSYHSSGPFNRMMLVTSCNIIPSATLFRKVVWRQVGGYNEMFTFNEDWVFWQSAAIRQLNFRYFPRPLYKYRKILNGISLSQSSRIFNGHIADEIKKRVPTEFYTKERISEYVIFGFKNNPRLFFKTLLLVLVPSRLHAKLELKLKNKIIVD